MRHKDSEDNNLYKILEFIKKTVKMFENLAMNKFRKVTETEINNIIEDLIAAQNDKKAMLIGIYE